MKVLHRQMIDELWIPYCTAEPERQFEAFCMHHGVSVSAKQATNFYDRGIGARMPIHSQVDEFIRSLRNRLRASASPGALIQNSRVFLSHAASDEHIALLLKAEIERRLPGVKVFCSSDPTDLPSGTKWSPEIQQALRDSTALFFVASERGLQRRWVWFECGTFWFSGKKIIPLCLGEVRKNALHPPLSELQAINGDESSDLKIALDVIAEATGLSLSDASDLDNLAEKLKQLDNRAAAALSIASGWRGVEWNGMFLAYEGPYRVRRRRRSEGGREHAELQRYDLRAIARAASVPRLVLAGSEPSLDVDLRDRRNRDPHDRQFRRLHRRMVGKATQRKTYGGYRCRPGAARVRLRPQPNLLFRVSFARRPRYA